MAMPRALPPVTDGHLVGIVPVACKSCRAVCTACKTSRAYPLIERPRLHVFDTQRRAAELHRPNAQTSSTRLVDRAKLTRCALAIVTSRAVEPGRGHAMRLSATR